MFQYAIYLLLYVVVFSLVFFIALKLFDLFSIYGTAARGGTGHAAACVGARQHNANDDSRL